MGKSLIEELEEIKKTIAEEKQITEQGGVAIVKALQHIVKRLEGISETEKSKKMKVLIVQQKSWAIDINPKELRSFVMEQLKDGTVLSLPVGIAYEVVEFDVVETPKSGGEHGND